MRSDGGDAVGSGVVMTGSSFARCVVCGLTSCSPKLVSGRIKLRANNYPLRAQVDTLPERPIDSPGPRDPRMRRGCEAARRFRGAVVHC